MWRAVKLRTRFVMGRQRGEEVGGYYNIYYYHLNQMKISVCVI